MQLSYIVSVLIKVSNPRFDKAVLRSKKLRGCNVPFTNGVYVPMEDGPLLVLTSRPDLIMVHQTR